MLKIKCYDLESLTNAAFVMPQSKHYIKLSKKQSNQKDELLESDPALNIDQTFRQLGTVFSGTSLYKPEPFIHLIIPSLIIRNKN